MQQQQLYKTQTERPGHGVEEERNLESELLATHSKFMQLKLKFNQKKFQNALPSLQAAKNNNKKYVNFEILEGFKIIVVENLKTAKQSIRALQNQSKDDVLQLDIQFDFEENDSNKNPQKILTVSVGCQQKFCVIFRACKWGFKIPQVLLDFLRTSGKKILVFKHYEKIKNMFEQNNIDFNNILYYPTLMLSMGYFEMGLLKFEEKFFGAQLSTTALSDWSKEQKNFAALKVFILGGIVRCLKQSYTRKNKCQNCKLRLGAFLNTSKKISTDYCDLCWRGNHDKKEQKSYKTLPISCGIFSCSNFEFGQLEQIFFPSVKDFLNQIPPIYCSPFEYPSSLTHKQSETKVNQQPLFNTYLESSVNSKKTMKQSQINEIQEQIEEFLGDKIKQEKRQERLKILAAKNDAQQEEKQNQKQDCQQKEKKFCSQKKNTIPHKKAKKFRKQKKNPQRKSELEISSLQHLINEAIQKKQQFSK